MNIKLSSRDTSSTFQPTRASRNLRDMIAELDLVDVGRKKFPRSRKYTWRKTSPLQQSRLDYIFTSKSMYRGEQTHVQIDPGIFSDNSFVVAEIDARKAVRGPGIWQFKNSLLEDDNFKCAVREEIGRCIKRDTPYNGEISIGVVVEMLLSNCRVIAMRRNTEIKRQQRKEEEEVTETLIILELNLSA